LRLSQFLDKQPIDVIQWSEPEAGTLAYRYPMLDMEIQTGARLTVRESEVAVFVQQGQIADVFGPGTHTLNAASLPLLARMKNWDKGFESPFKSDIYFFSTPGEIDQRWGTSAPIALRDTESGVIRLRSYGNYSYRIADVRTFFTQVSGTRESYSIYDLDDRLRNIIVARMADGVAASGLSYPDLTASAAALGDTLVGRIKPAFAALGLELLQFTIQSVGDKSQSAAGTMNCDCCGAGMRIDGGILKCDYCHDVVVPDAGVGGVGALMECEGHACPSCEISLLSATVGGASLLYCTRCDGMLVEMEELASLVAAARALPAGPVPMQAANPADLQHSIACPQCRHAMEAHFYSGNVAIDSCEGCGLKWLDHGALARIAHAPAADFSLDSNTSGAYFNPPQTVSSPEFNMGA